jgi:hypothetical protein
MQGPDELYVYSPAALPHMDSSVLSRATPLSLLDSARVTPAELVHRLPLLLRSSADVLSAAQIPTKLSRLTGLLFAVGMTEAGIDWTSGGLLPTLGIGGWTGDIWLDFVVNAAANRQQARRVADAVAAVEAAGFAGPRQCLSTLGNLRPLWRKAGVVTQRNSSVPAAFIEFQLICRVTPACDALHFTRELCNIWRIHHEQNSTAFQLGKLYMHEAFIKPAKSQRAPLLLSAQRCSEPSAAAGARAQLPLSVGFHVLRAAPAPAVAAA